MPSDSVFVFRPRVIGPDGVMAVSGGSMDELPKSVLQSTLEMFRDFFSGVGPASRTFGPDSPESRSMAESALTEKAVEFWYNKNAGAAPGDPLGDPLVNVTEYGGNFGIAGVIEAGADPIQQFVGSATYTIAADPSRGVLVVTAWNRTSLTSAGYKLLKSHDRSAEPAFGNIEQTYTWEVPLDWTRLAAPRAVPHPTPPQPTPTPPDEESTQ